MSKIQLIFTICLINLIQLSGSANILAIFYYPSYSHQVVFASLIRDLSERGHNLTVLAVDKMNYNHPNITEIHLKNSYDDNINFVDSSGLAGLRLVYNFIKASFIRTELQLNQPEVRELIDNHKNYKFDLLILEYIYASPHIGFSDLFNCPIVGFTAIDTGIPTHQKLGSSANPFIHPEIFFPYQHGKMTFFQRVSSFMFYIGLNFVLEPLFIAYGEYQATRIFKQKITLSEVEEKLQVLFVNTNPKLDYVRPITANMIQLGNMHIEPPKKLNSKLQEILDSSENGVIYMSLGSNVKSKDLSFKLQSIFIKVFASLPYDILWKYEDDTLQNVTKNVHISSWFPQSDLLAHPKVKLFISQGGLMSWEEAIDREVPIIAIPFLLDQHKNSMKMQEEGIGLQILSNNLNEESLTSAINEMMKPIYKENIIKFKKLLNDEPMSSRDKAIFWVEYTLRNPKSNHLKYPGSKISLYQKIGLDVISFLIISIYLTFKLIIYIKSLYQKFMKVKQA